MGARIILYYHAITGVHTFGITGLKNSVFNLNLEDNYICIKTNDYYTHIYNTI